MSNSRKKEPTNDADEEKKAGRLVSVPQCTPVGLAFPPVSTSSTFSSGIVTIAGLSDPRNLCIVSIYSLRPDLITAPPTVVIPRNVNSAAVPVILSPSGIAGQPYAALYARTAYGVVQGTVVVTPASSDAQSLVDANGAKNAEITITDVYFPDAEAPTDTGRVTFSAPLLADGTVYLQSFSDYFQVLHSVPVHAGDNSVEVTANVFFQSEAFTTQVAAQFGFSSMLSNEITVPCG